MAGQREQPRPRGAAGAQRGERGAAVVHDPGDVGHGLDVVDHGGLAVEADGGGEERGLDAREAALALERLEQRRLLAADVGAGAGVHDDVEREARVEDVAAHRAVGVGLVQRRLQALEAQGELPAQVDEGLADLQRVGRDQHALEDLVRVALNEHVVLEGGRLGLVAVDHQVGQRVLAQHRPLAPGREAGAAPAQQAGRVDLGRHRLGRHGQGLAQPGVATGGEVALQREGVLVAEACRDDLGGVGDGHQAFFSPSAQRLAARAACSWATVARSVLMAVCGRPAGRRCGAPAPACRGRAPCRTAGRRAGPRPARRSSRASAPRRSGG